MALSRALALGLAADDFRGNEQVEDSELVVTSARSQNLRCFMPVIDDGAAATVDNGYQCRFTVTVAGTIEVLDSVGRRITIVPRFGERVLTAAGDLANPIWIVTTPPKKLSTSDAAETGSVTVTLTGASDGPAIVGSPDDPLWYPIQLEGGVIGTIAVWV